MSVTMLLWLLWVCSIVWCLGALCLLLCSFFSGMLWQFWIFLWSHIYFMVICSSSVENVTGNLIVCVCVLSSVWFFATTWTVACQTPLSMGFPRQEHWSGVLFPTPGAHPNPGMEPACPSSAGAFFTTEPPGKRRWVSFNSGSHWFLLLLIFLWATPLSAVPLLSNTELSIYSTFK